MKQELNQEIQKLADRIIDLSKRNRMINTKFSSRSKIHFRIIDEIPDLLYKKLSKGNMEFIPLPPLDKEPPNENTPKFKKALTIAEQTDEEYLNTIQKIETEQTDNLGEDYEKALRNLKDKIRAKLGKPPRVTEDISIKEHAKKKGFNPNFDLPRPTPDSKNNRKWNDKKIQTLMLPDSLRSHINSIYRRYKSSLKEAGVNPLFFCFGFLEWTESSNSDHKLYSPLLTLQANFDKQRTKLFITGIGEELSLNQALKEKLKQTFRIELPELPEFTEEEDSQNISLIDEYLQSVEKTIKTNNPNWKIKNWVSFGLYNAQYMSIYRDLLNISQTNDKDSCLEKILLGKDSNTDRESLEKYNIDDEKSQKILPVLIESADSSQYSAILDVLKGKNLVIQGPPGTGKSQTIANLIATLISRGKKVLFVAQKQAALDVVRNKLSANGLSDYMLEIFSARANKKRIIDSIKKRLESTPPRISHNREKTINSFWEIKRKLNDYSELISKKYKNISLHDILWNYNPNKKTIPFNAESLSDYSIKKNSEELKPLKDIYLKYNLKSLKDNPLYKIKELPPAHNKIQSIENDMKGLLEKIKSFFEEEREILKINNSLKTIDKTVFNHDLIKDWLSLDEKKRKKHLDLLCIIFNVSLEDLENYIESKEQYIEISETNEKHKQKISSVCRLENPPELSEIKKASSILEKNQITDIFSSEWQKVKKFFKNIYIGEIELLSHQEIKSVLNNEQEIFSRSNHWIGIINHYAESEDLKKYLKIKQKYRQIEKTNKEHKQKISSVCRLENLPDKMEISRAVFNLKDSGLFSVFQNKYRKANKVFKQVYIGKKGEYSKHSILENLYNYLNNLPAKEKQEKEYKKQIEDLHKQLQKSIAETNNSACDTLKNLYDYLKNLDDNKNKEENRKKEKNVFYKKIYNQTKLENLDDVLNTTEKNITLQMAQDSKSLESEFKKDWLNQPNFIIQYKNLIEKKEKLIEESSKLCDSISAAFPNCKNKLKNIEDFLKNP